MLIYSITGRKYAADLNGIGAAITGGRWNKKGTSVLYTGESIEIALLENIVHTPPMLIPNLDLLTLDIPKDSITTIQIKDLPPNWADYPAPSILAEIAESWIKEGVKIALKVPSAIVHKANNYILNASHPKYRTKVKLKNRQGFHFDARLNS